MTPLKGIYDLFKAILILREEKFINQKINLNIVGSYNQEIKKDLLKITSKISSSSLNIKFLGYLNSTNSLNASLALGPELITPPPL